MTRTARIKNFIRKSKSVSGFTITEMLIVLFITGILAGMTLPNFNTFNRRQKIQQGVKKLKTDIRTAQSRALTGYKYNNQAVAWAVRLTAGSSSYVFFACESSSNPADYKFTAASCASVQSATLAENIEITGISPATPMSVIFDVVSGEVYFKNDDGSLEYPGPVIIDVNYRGWDASEKRELQLTRGGNIEDIKR